MDKWQKGKHQGGQWFLHDFLVCMSWIHGTTERHLGCQTFGKEKKDRKLLLPSLSHNSRATCLFKLVMHNPVVLTGGTIP